MPSGGGDHACGDAALPSGDGELLLSLYREERPFLLRVIKNNPYCLAGMEEDILHEAVERLLEKVGKDHKGWESRAHCRNSLLVTAKNLAIDHSRREARRSRLFLYQAELVRHASGEREEGEPFLDYEGLVARSGSDNGPEDLLLRSEDYSRVRVMLESLEEEEKHLLFMREELGLPWEKVAAVVGTSPETLRVRYARLKARLRRAFRDGVGS
ncbi:MAG: sigma-70 family RNA polymerase sigma factor [Actinobacteria bacterium]|nr:sigma-70 family RNA polymerase sigma factor [Actinomycetota bacterium]